MRKRSSTLLVIVLAAGCGGGGGGSNEARPAARQHTVTIEWRAPSARVDGSALAMSSIGGYVLNIGRAPGDYQRHVAIADAYKTTYTLSSERKTTYYLSLQTYDRSGRRGPPSPELKIRTR